MGRTMSVTRELATAVNADAKLRHESAMWANMHAVRKMSSHQADSDLEDVVPKREVGEVVPETADAATGAVIAIAPSTVLSLKLFEARHVIIFSVFKHRIYVLIRTS